MKILVVHNSYQQAGGEDAVVASEVELLRAHGHEVECYGRSNHEIGAMSRLALARDTLWSPRSTEELTQLIARFAPDVMHVHNTFPLISPAAYWAADAAGVPVVQTLHNFRLLCPQAMYLRQGKVCEDCAGTVPWRGVVRGCYRDSIPQSLVLTAMLTMHRTLGTYRSKVARYIALSEFGRDKFIAGGLPAGRIVVKPNFVDFEPPVETQREGFLYVGRLSPEKGVALLADVLSAQAASAGGMHLRVAGTGPEAACLEGIPGVAMLGGLDGGQVRAEMGRAQALVMPSVWYEGFPRTLVEAYGCGLPVIASRLGALPELVEEGVTGLLFEPGNAADLAMKMQWAQAHPAEMAEMGRRARRRYEERYTAEHNYAQLLAIYRAVIEERQTVAA